jgi:type III restriction enzyme
VLDAELDADTLVAWYRNPPAGRNALAVPYEYGDRTLLHHPDFLFFHDDDGLLIDIVDPHQHNDAATSARWSALARYAEDHPVNIRRVLAVIRDSEARLRSLDLTGAGIRDRLVDATDQAKIEAVFDQHGADY